MDMDMSSVQMYTVLWQFQQYQQYNKWDLCSSWCDGCLVFFLVFCLWPRAIIYITYLYINDMTIFLLLCLLPLDIFISDRAIWLQSPNNYSNGICMRCDANKFRDETLGLRQFYMWLNVWHVLFSGIVRESIQCVFFSFFLSFLK